jgi:DNA repair protein RadA/Sms
VRPRSVVGGLDLAEPAADLGVAVAAASAVTGAPVDPEALVFGEVGLAGELRGVGRADLRLAEARRMGFARAVVPASNAGAPHPEGLQVVGVASLREALEQVLRYPSGGRTRSARRE